VGRAKSPFQISDCSLDLCCLVNKSAVVSSAVANYELAYVYSANISMVFFITVAEKNIVR